MTHKEEYATFSLYSTLQFDESSIDPSLPNGDTPVSGFAIHQGLFKEVIEVGEGEFPNIEQKLKNAQLRKDHGESVDDVIGKVKIASAGFDDIAQKPGVFYKAFIDKSEEKLANKVQKGLIGDVSLGFTMFPECSVCGEDFRECGHWFTEEFGNAHIIAKNVNVFELSLVTRGADKEATASVGAFKAQFSDKLSRESFKKEEKIMVDKPSEPTKNLDLEELFKKSTDQATEIANLQAALQAQLDLTDKEKEAKEDLEGKLNENTQKFTDLEGKFDDLTEQFNTTSTKLTDVEKTERENEVKDIVDLEIEKGIFSEEDRDTRVKILMEAGDLKVAKEYVEKFQKVAKGNPGLGEFHNPGGEHKFDEVKLNNRGEFYFEDKKEMTKFYTHPDVTQQYVHQIFGYDKVFRTDKKDKVEGKSYMGFNESQSNNGGGYVTRSSFDRARRQVLVNN
jgi:hypothetical protein